MDTFNGLPAHVLLVHGIVVLLPLSALLLVLTAVWPAARQRLAGPNAILAGLVVLMVPVTTDAGEWLEQRMPGTPLLHTHAELGDTAIFYAIPIAALALVVWWRGREAGGSAGRRTFLAPLSSAVTAVVAVLALAAAVAGVYGIYRIGDSGAKAAWTGNFSTTARPGHD
ncbi:DUF2231 domain-containing protein [Dactylosporangium matsuzakiense]|uniref:DUF2231 domain-containing protein n=1 Tax=Dactylosporangium matsuzakiense TaxID=53360 RepID=A0A9W6KGB2_9ACTN|nr:DUF2231 domain-containing protein [Dactylosporangium matsuzakiense]UWZ48306.1 hypothetical protein Dmats_18995 [Dactylosporangium matsuzakiense]GLL01547.1 hypothetical protein GCM10017581_032880 [Dactylosporangium matsuzakiense]